MVGEVKPPLIERESGKWETVIGLEVHAQVTSESKLFSTANTSFTVEPNINISLFDIAFPGMLPILNRECVRQAVRTGLGLNGTVNEKSVFDRKSYFYPDLPQGYQISQFFHPIVTGGYLDLLVGGQGGYEKRVHLERVHLEQDAGKSIHDLFPGKTAIDLNRAGVALMEIVTKPEMRSAEEAAAFVKYLRLLLRYLGTCDANMDQGSLRADVNVSVRKEGEPLGTRVELKNINSIKFISKAIEVESLRQIELIESGGKVLQQTCTFDPNTYVVKPLRAKEDEIDYRYFPDPDLPPLYLEQSFIDDQRRCLPELPLARAARYQQDYKLAPYEAHVLVEDKLVGDFFEDVVIALQGKPQAPREAAMWIIGEVFAATSTDVKISDLKITPNTLAELVECVIDGVISRTTSKDVFAHMLKTGEAPRAFIEEKGLTQVSDEGTILAWAQEVVQEHPKEVEAYHGGKDKLLGFFVGQVMRKSSGKANPQVVASIVSKTLQSALTKS